MPKAAVLPVPVCARGSKIAAGFEQNGNGLFLDRRGLFKTQAGDGSLYFAAHTQLFKGIQSLVLRPQR